MATRMLVLVAALGLVGCKDTSAPPPPPTPTPAPADAGSALATREELRALRERIDALIERGDDVGSVPLAKDLVDKTRRAAPADLPLALTTLGMQLHVTGDWRGAVIVLEEAYQLLAATKEPDPKLASEVTFQLGSIYSEQRRIDDAVRVLRESIAYATTAYGADSVNVAINTESLASALDYGERYADAEPLFRQVLAAYEKDGEPLRVGRALSNLAINLEFQDRDADALPLYRRALPLLDGATGFARSSLAEVHAGMGRIYRRDRRQAKLAVPAFRQALEVRLQALPADHPLVAMDLHNLATALEDQHQLREARQACERARAIRAVKLAPDHPYRVGTEELCARLAAAK